VAAFFYLGDETLDFPVGGGLQVGKRKTKPDIFLSGKTHLITWGGCSDKLHSLSFTFLLFHNFHQAGRLIGRLAESSDDDWNRKNTEWKKEKNVRLRMYGTPKMGTIFIICKGFSKIKDPSDTDVCWISDRQEFREF
jgi:hypothetical protein